MPRAPDLALHARWQRRLQAFEDFAGTVPQFCDQEQVSVASFYQWRRKLARQELVRQATRATPPAFVALQVNAAREAHRDEVSIELPGGAHLQVPGDNLPLVQAVLACLLEHDAREHDARRGEGGDA